MLGSMMVPRLDPRLHMRSNVFIAAVVEEAGRRYAVRVRNISRKGALIDGTNLPKKGAAFHLIRGFLTAPGEVAWVAQNYCGIRFSKDVEVAEWVARPHSVGHQRENDAMAPMRVDGRACGDGRALTRDSVAIISANLVAACERIADLGSISTAHAVELRRLADLAARLQELAKASTNP